ncbi:CocE/NonD family hydrolase [Streptomyces sp. NPDC059452]|uniref:CocE/NonD family hydrolase n=1 Tax=Streptomyces sp. NPDC059452 TaxID=3346835 RepID=UPI0036B86572
MSTAFSADNSAARAVVYLCSRRWGVAHLLEYRTETQKRLGIPMRDGVRLMADVVRPTGAPRSDETQPVVIIRTPYGRRALGTGLTARLLASTGVMVVVVSCRGTFDSEGRFEPFVNEAADGCDTLQWVRAQSWGKDRRIVLWGASYEGYNQWALAAQQETDVSACVVQLGASSMRDGFVYQHGALAIADVLAWVRIVRAQSSLLRLATDFRATSRERRAAEQLPYSSMDERAGYGQVDWFRDWAAHGPEDPWWLVTEHRNAAARNENTTWHVTAGWHDVYLQAALKDYETLIKEGRSVRLVVGPWKHMDSNYLRHVLPESLELTKGMRIESGARIWVTGERPGWSEWNVWPPLSSELTLHIHQERLHEDPPGTASTSRLVLEDQPTPAVGGIRAFLPQSPVCDNSKREQREDVRVYTWESLSESLLVMGTPEVELALRAASAGHLDIHVRMCEVNRKGKSLFVSEGFCRTSIPETLTRQVTIPLAPLAHRFASGSRIRLQVATGSFPTWGPHPGSDGSGKDVLQEWEVVHEALAVSGGGGGACVSGPPTVHHTNKQQKDAR